MSTHSKTIPSFLIGVLSAVTLMVFDLFQPALPAITKYFSTTHSIAQLTLSLYLFFLGVGQLLWGPILDVYGRRKPFLYGMVVFLAATLLCILSPNIELLIVGRVLQSLSAAVTSVIAISAARDYDDQIQRAKQMSINAMVIALSPIFSPIIGALLFRYFGWQSNFVFMLLMVLMIGLVSFKSLTESPNFHGGKQFSLTELVRSFQFVLRKKIFWVSAVIFMFSFSCLTIFVVNASYILIGRFNLSPLQFSGAYGLFGMFVILGNFIGVNLRNRFSLVLNVYFGSLLILMGSATMTIMFILFGICLFALLPMSVVVIGVSLINPAVQSRALEPFSTHAGSAASLLGTFRIVGGALLGGLVGVFLNSYFLLFPMSILACSLMILLIYTFVIPQHIKDSKTP